MCLDPHALKIHIDGSALENPGPGGIAAIVEFPDDWLRPDEEIFRIGFHATTNNRMELTAAVRALEYIRAGIAKGIQRVIIVTDSQYVHNNYVYASAWRRNGWKNFAGRPVENKDLWKDFLSSFSKCRVRVDIVWRKGKTTPVSKAVDRAAKEAARNTEMQDGGFRPGKVARSRGGPRVSAKLFPAEGQQAVVRIYRNQLVGKSGHKISFDLYSEEQKAFVGKFVAYADAGALHGLHRGHCYRVQFNDNPKYPIIEAMIEEIVP
jgi:ribonuclease HI